jgi:hypothetical protein
MVMFYGEELLAPRPTHKHPLSAARGGGEKIDPAQDRDRWRAGPGNGAMNHRVPENAREFLTSRVSLSFSRTMLHGVSVVSLVDTALRRLA